MPAIRAVFLLVGAILGVFYPFVPPILAGRGFSAEEIGLTTAIAALAFTLSVPVWGHLADIVLGRVVALRVAVVGSSIAVLGLLFGGPPILVALLIVVYAAFESALAPLADALAVNALASSPRSYARVRLLTSLGFTATSILAGRLYNETGFQPAYVLWAVVGGAIILATWWVPDVARFRGLEPVRRDPAAGPDGAAGRDAAAGPGGAAGRDAAAGRGAAAGRPTLGRGGSFAFALRTQPRLRSVLVGLGLVHIGIMAGFTFLALRLLELGGQPSDVALSAGLSAFAEIPAMALIPRIVARTGSRALLVAGIILYAFCMLSWAFLGDPTLIIATRLVSGVAYAAIAITAVMTIASLLPAELQGTGQGLYQTVGYGVAGVIANSVGGIVYGSGGAMPLFLGCVVLAGFGAIVAWRSVPSHAAHGRIAARQEG